MHIYFNAKDMSDFLHKTIDNYGAMVKRLDPDNQSNDISALFNSIKIKRQTILKELVRHLFKSSLEATEDLPERVQKFTKALREKYPDQTDQTTQLLTKSLRDHQERIAEIKSLRTELKSLRKSAEEVDKAMQKIDTLKKQKVRLTDRWLKFNGLGINHLFKTVSKRLDAMNDPICYHKISDYPITPENIKTHYPRPFRRKTDAQKKFKHIVDAFVNQARIDTGLPSLTIEEIFAHANEYKAVKEKSEQLWDERSTTCYRLEKIEAPLKRYTEIRKILAHKTKLASLEQLSQEVSEIVLNDLSPLHSDFLQGTAFEALATQCQNHLKLCDDIVNQLTSLSKHITSRTIEQLEHAEEYIFDKIKYGFIESCEKEPVEQANGNAEITSHLIILALKEMAEEISHLDTSVTTYRDLYDALPDHHYALDILRRHHTQARPSDAALRHVETGDLKWKAPKEIAFYPFETLLKTGLSDLIEKGRDVLSDQRDREHNEMLEESERRRRHHRRLLLSYQPTYY